LLNSRLVVRKPSRFAKPAVWAAVLGATVVLAIAAAWFDLASQRREVKDMQARLKEAQPEIKAAEAAIARISFAQRWNDQDPRVLAVLRDLTAVFPGDGRVWANTVNVQDDGRVTLTGRGTSEPAAQAALDRLRASGRFTELKVLDMRPAGRNSGDVSFSASFRIVGATPGATSGAGASSGAAGARATTQAASPVRRK
jgi:hypothetical protein